MSGGCLITLQGVTMLFQSINMDRASCYSSSCFSPSAIFSARIPYFSPKSPDFEMAVPGFFWKIGHGFCGTLVLFLIT